MLWLTFWVSHSCTTSSLFICYVSFVHCMWVALICILHLMWNCGVGRVKISNKFLHLKSEYRCLLSYNRHAYSLWLVVATCWWPWTYIYINEWKFIQMDYVVSLLLQVSCCRGSSFGLPCLRLHAFQTGLAVAIPGRHAVEVCHCSVLVLVPPLRVLAVFEVPRMRNRLHLDI